MNLALYNTLYLCTDSLYLLIYLSTTVYVPWSVHLWVTINNMKKQDIHEIYAVNLLYLACELLRSDNKNTCSCIIIGK